MQRFVERCAALVPGVLFFVPFFVLGAVGGCAKSNLASSATTLNYLDHGRMAATQVTDPVNGVGTLAVTDDRADDMRGGTRKGEKDGSTAEIAINGDAAAWVAAGARHVFGGAGIGFDDGPIEMRIRLVEFSLEESVYVNSSYTSRVTLEVRLYNDGEEVWLGTRSGQAGNFGRPAKQENYEETFNHALSKALDMILQDAAFRAVFKAG